MMAAAPADGIRRLPWLVRGLLVIGIAFVLGALVLVVHQARFLASSARATGTIVAIEQAPMRDVNNRNTGIGNRLVVSFTTAAGQAITLRSPITSSATWSRVGDRVAVNYAAGDPRKAVLDKVADRWLFPMVLGSIGAMALALFALAAWMMRQPGMRFYGDGRWSFGMSVGSNGRDGAAAAPAAPAPPMIVRDAATPTRHLPLIVAGLIGAAAIGFLGARMMDGGHAPAVENASAAAHDVPPRPGYPDTNTSVTVPPMKPIGLTPAERPPPRDDPAS